MTKGEDGSWRHNAGLCWQHNACVIPQRSSNITAPANAHHWQELYIAHWDNPHLATLTRDEHAGWNGGGHGVAKAKDGGGRDRGHAQGAKEDLGEGAAGKMEAEDERAAVAACAWPVISLDVLWHDPH